MNICVRKKSFNDKKDKSKIIEYNEFYVKFDFCVDGKSIEEIELVLKIKDKLTKTILYENLATANFTINSNTSSNGKVYHNPVVNFYVGKSSYKVDVEMSPEAVVLARIAIAAENDTTNLGF